MVWIYVGTWECLHISNTIPETLLHQIVINLVSFPVSWALPCVQLHFSFLEPRIHHYQIMLLAEVDKHLASLISSTKSKRSDREGKQWQQWKECVEIGKNWGNGWSEAIPTLNSSRNWRRRSWIIQSIMCSDNSISLFSKHFKFTSVTDFGCVVKKTNQ